MLESENILTALSTHVLSFASLFHMVSTHIHDMVATMVLLRTFRLLTDGAYKTVFHNASSLAVVKEKALRIRGYYDKDVGGCKREMNLMGNQNYIS